MIELIAVLRIELNISSLVAWSELWMISSVISSGRGLIRLAGGQIGQGLLDQESQLGGAELLEGGEHVLLDPCPPILELCDVAALHDRGEGFAAGNRRA